MHARRTTGLALACLALLCLGAKTPLDLGGSTWSFPTTLLKVSAKAKGIGKTKEKGPGDAIEIHLMGDGNWDADVAGEAFVSGTWTRKNAFSKKVELLLDAPSTATLLASYATEAEDLAAADGIVADVELTTLDKAVLRLKLKPKKKAGTISAKLTVKLKASGTTSALGKLATTKVKVKNTGDSLMQELGPLVADT